MNCNRCGSPLTENDQFCKSCGAPANVMSAQNMNIGNVAPNFGGTPTTNEVNNQYVQPIPNQVTPTFGTPMNNNTMNPVVEPVQTAIGNQFIGPMNNEMTPNFGNPMNNNTMNPVVEPVQTAMDNQFIGPMNNEMTPNFENPLNNNTMNPVVEPVQTAMDNQFMGPMNNEMTPNFGNPVNNNTMNQMVGQTYNNQTNSQPVKKNSKAPLFIILGIVGVVALVAAIIFGMKFLGNDSNDDTNNGGIANVPENTSIYKVNYNGFTFKIPTDLVYQAEKNMLLLGDEEDTWIIMIQIAEGSFEKLVSNKGNLQSVIQQKGNKASAAEEKTIGGMKFVTIEVSQSGQNTLIAYSKANSMYTFAITAYNQDNDFDYDLLKTAAKVLNSAEYTGESNSIKTNIEIGLESISELLK